MHIHNILTDKMLFSNKHLQGTTLKLKFSPFFHIFLLLPLPITAQHLSEYKLKKLHL